MSHLEEMSFLPGPLWLITTLHLLTLTLHLLAMNFVLGGTLVLLTGRLPGGWGHSTARRFGVLAPSMMAATVTLGVAPLLFAQLVYFGPVYSATIVSAWWWLLVIAAVILSYYAFYAAAWRKTLDDPARRGLFVLALAGLVYVSLVYSTVLSMAERADLVNSIYRADQSGGAINNAPGTWVLRWLHMAFGAVAVGGFFVGLLGRGDPASMSLGRRALAWGMAGGAIVGLVWVGTLGPRLGPFMKTPAPWSLLGAIVLALGALHFNFRGRFVPAGMMIGLSVLGMVTTRHLLRDVTLAGSFSPASLPVRPQWGVFAAFLVCFVMALAVVAWMLRRFLEGAGRFPAPREG